MILADFHIHSKYSRATSRDCVPEFLDLWACRKGLGLIGTGDFTHAAWRQELQEKLMPAEEGLFVLKPAYRLPEAAGNPPRFMLSGEISSIYKSGGRVRKVHNLILLPSFEAAQALSSRLESLGANLHSDGRPILGLSSHDLLEITLEACPDAEFIPAHIWTPHFSLFGAFSGFEDIAECFGDLTPHIHALETGLSSDPPMNWRLSALDAYTLVSNSDAHSPANLAREANLLDCPLSYTAVRNALHKNNPGFAGTIEFFPEEGKYHLDGHRACSVCLSPAETQNLHGVCPKCGGRITVGVLARVEALADRPEGFAPPAAPHFENLVPLLEATASSIGVTPASKKAVQLYHSLLRSLGSELFILRQAPLDEIERQAGPCVAEGIRRMRQGKVRRIPGYDGEYGKIQLLDKDEIDAILGQMRFAGIGFDRPVKTAGANNSHAAQKQDIPKPAIHPAASFGLNPEQLEAASSVSPVVAVVAGPGTGKTRTLVYRIAHLVEKCAVPPGRITAVTFTNKAAEEMRARLEKHFGDKKTVRAMHIGTFHSICLGLLLQWKDNATLIDEFQSQALLADALGQSPSQTRDALLRISRIKSGAVKPDDADEAYRQYCAQLDGYALMDFDDVLLRVLARFEAGVEESAHLPFTHLLVDEFQDINAVQYRLVREWGKNSDGIFLIGDPDQSIYGFRGSNSRCFDSLSSDFTGVHTVRLSRNYRSAPQILHCALPVLSGPPRSLQAERENGAKVHIVQAQDSFQEALFVTKAIRMAVGGADMLDAHAPTAAGIVQARGFSDTAVLFRTHRQADMLEECLQKEGIPYVVAGRDDFLADRQVRGFLSFFRFLLASKEYFLAESMQAAGIHPEHRKIILQHTGSGSPSAELEAHPVSGFHLSQAQHFIGLMQTYRPLVRKDRPASLLASWIRDNALDGNPAMESLLQAAVLHTSMPAFIDTLVLGGEPDVVRSGSKKYTPEAVTLMTLHASKGLEYPLVFICGVSEGLIPYKGFRESSQEEERRLLYVGMTRAQDELFLLTSPTPSPFLANIPAAFSVSQTAFARKPVQGRQLGLFDG